MKKPLITIPLITIPLITIYPCFAAFETKPFAARPAAMCGAYAAVSNDASAPFYNPAGLNIFNATTLSFSQVSLYGESDLKYNGTGASLPTLKAGSFAFNYTSFGSDFYKEGELIFTHSFMLSPGAYFGYNLRRESLSISGGGRASATAFDVGALGMISPELSLGFYSKGLNRPSIAGEYTYRELDGGICYRPFRGMLAALDWSIPADRSENIMKAGAEFDVIPTFCLRFGVQPSPQRASFGFALMLKYFDLDYAYVTHETLADEQVFSLSMRWGEKRETAAPTKYYKKKAKKRRAIKSGKVEPTDINEAGVADFDALPGIGKVTATRIVEYRNTNGPFKSVDDLMNVPHFRKKQLDKIRDYVTAGRAAESHPSFEKAQPEEQPQEEAPQNMSEKEKTKLMKKYYFKGLKLYQAKKYKEAIDIFNKILKIDPTHPQSLRIIQKCEDALGNNY